MTTPPNMCTAAPIEDKAVANDAGTKSPVDDLKLDQRTFPEQLMDIIEKETADGHGVVEWVAGGDAFVVRDKMKLETEVLPRHFNVKCKYMSFFRKLYRWGFRQLDKNSSDNMIFCHKDFKRGNKKQCLVMRSTVKRPASSVSSRTNIKHEDELRSQNNKNNNGNNGLNMLNGNQLGGMHNQGGNSFMSHQQGGNNFGGLPFGASGGHQNQLPMMMNTQQELFNSFCNQRGFDPSSLAAQAALSASARFNAFENSGHNNNMSNMKANLPSSSSDNFPSNSGNSGGLTSTDLFQASLNLRAIEREQLQSQLGMMSAMRGSGSNNNTPFSLSNQHQQQSCSPMQGSNNGSGAAAIIPGADMNNHVNMGSFFGKSYNMNGNNNSMPNNINHGRSDVLPSPRDAQFNNHGRSNALPSPRDAQFHNGNHDFRSSNSSGHSPSFMK